VCGTGFETEIVDQLKDDARSGKAPGLFLLPERTTYVDAGWHG
jgi:hypothetical protein